MNIIVVGKHNKASKNYHFGTATKLLVLTSLCLLPFAMGVTGYVIAQHLADDGLLDPVAAKAWEKDLGDQRLQLQELREPTASSMPDG